MAALDTAHAALALELPTLLAPRLSSGDPRPRHRGLSHHTATVLELLLAGVTVPLPDAGDGLWPDGVREEIEEACGTRHAAVAHPVDLEGYASSGLPSRTMGRDLDDDAIFFAAALAAGGALAGAAGEGSE
jgi:hypothetical protein